MITKYLHHPPSKKCWNCACELLEEQIDKHNFIERYKVYKCYLCGRHLKYYFDWEYWEERNRIVTSIYRKYKSFLNDFEKSFLTNILNFQVCSKKQERILQNIRKKYEDFEY
jgi:hypothetical protein